MFKRLSVSLLVMGLAAFGLGAAAFSWFSDSETGQVSIQSGSTNIAITADQDCNGGPLDVIDGVPFPLAWEGIVPGDSTMDCFIVTNEGDGALDVYVKHTGVGGALSDIITFTYDNNNNDGDGVWCGPNLADDDAFTVNNEGRGCFLGTLAEGETAALPFEVRVLFPDSGGDQNNLQNRALNFNAVVTGYTS